MEIYAQLKTDVLERAPIQILVFTRLLVQNRWEQQNHIVLKNNIVVVFNNYIVCFACLSFFLTKRRLSQ